MIDIGVYEGNWENDKKDGRGVKLLAFLLIPSLLFFFFKFKIPIFLRLQNTAMETFTTVVGKPIKCMDEVIAEVQFFF